MNVILDTNKIDITTSKSFDKKAGIHLTTSTGSDRVAIFVDDFSHLAEQFISAMFDHDEEMACKILEQHGNITNLKDEINNLKEEVEYYVAKLDARM